MEVGLSEVSFPPRASKCPPNDTRVDLITGKLLTFFHISPSILDPSVSGVRRSGRRQVKTDLDGQKP